ncbi:unnamed protein product [Sphagnum balticum]
MANKGMALMGTGRAAGENRAVEAATAAISSPLLENISIDGATGIIINVTGGPDLTMFEVNEASTLITEAAHEDAEIIFGAVIDDSISDEVRVTVIATGFGRDEKTFSEQMTQMSQAVQMQATPQPPVQTSPYSAPQPQTQPMPTPFPAFNLAQPATYPQSSQQPQQPQQQPPQAPYQLDVPAQASQAPYQSQSLAQPVAQQIEMPATRDHSPKPILPRDILLAKAKAFREIQNSSQQQLKNRRPEPVQLTMPVAPEGNPSTSTGPDLESARRLAREVGRQFDEKSYDIPAFIRKNQRPPEPL